MLGLCGHYRCRKKSLVFKENIALKGNNEFAGTVANIEGGLIYTIRHEAFVSSDDYEFAEATDILEGMLF